MDQRVGCSNPASGTTQLIIGGRGLHAWIDQGGDRRAGRAALLRFWTRQGLLWMPCPLIAAATLRAEQSWAPAAWLSAFLEALADEAEAGLQTLTTLERAWLLRAARPAASAAPRAPPPLPPLTPLERRNFDYSGLEAATAFADEAMRNARKLFAALPSRGLETAESPEAVIPDRGAGSAPSPTGSPDGWVPTAEED